MIKKILPIFFYAATALSQTMGNNTLCNGTTPCVAVDPAGAAAAITGGVKYNGIQASPPTVTPTLNTNQLAYTGELYNGIWNSTNMLSATGPFSDENSASTATIIVPTTANARHRFSWAPIWEPSLTASTAISTSVWVKPFGSTQPYFELYFQLGDGSSTSIVGWFNASTCATVSITSGATSAATAAGNGYCLVSILYTIPAATFVTQWNGAFSSSSTSDAFAGNGTDGGYISHPMLGASSTLLAYQDVTSTHRYACIAYDANGNTGGISSWVTPTSYPAAAEVNSVTCPAVTGGVTYYVYRTGGYTQGRYPVTAGTALNDNSLVFDGSTPITGNVVNTVARPIPDVRPSLSQSTIVGLGTAVTNTPVTIFNGEPGLQGSITHLHLTLSMANTGFYTTLPDTAFLHVMCNGAAFGSAGDQVISLGGLFYTEDVPTLLNGSYTAVTNNSPAYFSANKAWAKGIPFTNGCQMAIYATGVTFAQVFAEVNYKVGQYYADPYAKSWHSYETPLTAYAAYAYIPILPTVTSAGELENLMVFESTGSNYQYFEGNLSVIGDGAAMVVCNGAEDCMAGGSFYYNFGTLSAQTDHWDNWIGSGLTNPLASRDSLEYRQFGHPGLGDDIFFNNTVLVQLQVGQQGEPTPPGVSAKTAITYYTAP